MKDIELALQNIKDESLTALKETFGDSYEGSKQEIEELLKESEEKAKEWAADLITGVTRIEAVKYFLETEKSLYENTLIKIAGIQQINAANLKDKLIQILIEKLGELANKQ